ncbi:claudin-10-like isoform X1 [Boleophthalmus pectinirostris]|uniref:claudin-10-like isoform X1 n=1 Tax=Boleophthalmus pectinirostris TaxID=150288 RepID=UPI00242AF01D|nr:claudin-10-like isoform X1 [Boleophthalmus pectinirostris]
MAGDKQGVLGNHGHLGAAGVVEQLCWECHWSSALPAPSHHPQAGSMFQEILAFILTTSGWVLVSSTLPTDYWKVSSIDGTVITTATFWSNLWKTCVTDSTGVSNCKDFPSMLALDGYIQACRGLMIAAVCLGFFGSIFALVGMKCTKIGGSDQNKARIACLAGVSFILSGLCSLSACSLYAHRITSEFFDPMFVAQKYELGAALFIGWAGSVLCILGGCMFCFSIAGSFSKSHSQRSYIYKGTVSHVTSFPKGQAPGYTRPAPKYSTSSRNQAFDKNEYV